MTAQLDRSEESTGTNNKQNQMPENLHLDTKVEGWALWFCLPPLCTSIYRGMRLQLTIVFILITPLIFGQINLVPNPSFEEYSSCPYHYSQICFANYWDSFAAGGQEYFNSCDTTNYLSVPQNVDGFQYAYDGEAYAGLYFNNPFAPNNQREAIGCRLIDSLVIGERYYMSFHVSFSGLSKYVCNNIGLLFSTVNYNTSSCFSSQWSIVRNYAHLYTSQVIIDTTDWITIQGSFIADSNYQYVIISNFFDDNNTITDTVNYGINTAAYYYLDLVCVSTDSLICNTPNNINDKNVQNSIFVYPNPATNDLTIDYVLTDRSWFKLYDVFGTKRNAVTIVKGSNKIDLTDIDSGVYFYKVVDLKGKIIKTDKLIIEK